MPSAMMRAALSGWKGAGSSSPYPSSLTTGPTAGGYTGLTPETITTFAAIANTGNPSWAPTIGGVITVSGCAFTCQAGILVSATTVPVLFQGCTFDFNGIATTGSPEMFDLTGGTQVTFSYCTVYGDSYLGTTRIAQIINQSNDCVLSVDHCDLSGARQCIQLASGTTAGVSITNNYMHDLVELSVVTPNPTLTPGTGGTMADGTYNVITAYNNSNGKAIGSSSVTATLSNGSSVGTLAISSPPTLSGWPDWYAYVTPVGGGSIYYQQQTGSGTATSTSLTLTAAPTTTGSTSVPGIDHSECVYAGVNTGGSNITVTGNTMLNPLTQTACLYLHPTVPFTNVTVSGNFFAGGDYCMYCGATTGSTSLVIENNVFSTIYYAGGGSATNPAAATSGPATFTGSNVWSNNTWYDGVNAGNLITAP